MRYDAIGAPEALAILDDGEDDGNKPMEDDGGTKDTSPDDLSGHTEFATAGGCARATLASSSAAAAPNTMCKYRT